MTRAERLTGLYDAGRQARTQFGSRGAYWSAVESGAVEMPAGLGLDDNAAEQFFYHGLRGLPCPVPASAWRIGALPRSGASRNYRDDSWEPGVSCLGGDGTFEMFNDGPRIRVTGYLLARRGSDGEPLLVDAVKID
ncbi:MAG: hypothetical protein KGL39_59560 [Patescibacteria group bacterium]|nr:hypothetical protein [Patescibacteria group bacterium]